MNGVVDVTIVDSKVSANSASGIAIIGNTNGLAHASITNSIMTDNNAGIGFDHGTALLSRNTIVRNNYSFSLGAAAPVVYSYGDNDIALNATETAGVLTLLVAQ